MIAAHYIHNRRFAKYADMLRELHKLMARGEGDSDAADALRDAGDEPWNQLTDDEQKRIRGMSADLYALEPDSPFAHPISGGILSAEIGARIRAARNERRFASVLDILRENPEAVSADRAAFIRGEMYEKLGDLATAILFYRNALEREPTNSYYAFYLIQAIASGDIAEAACEVDKLVVRSMNIPTALRAYAGSIYLNHALSIDNGAARDVFLKAAAQFRDVIDCGPREHGLATIALSNAFAGLAVCENYLHGSTAAVRVLNSGIARLPRESELLVLRGILLLSDEIESAMNDFQQVVALGSHEVWPHYFLASHALVSNRFQECVNHALDALALTREPELKADLLEWLAISKSNLGFPREEIAAHLRDAASIMPENERIKANYDSFLAFDSESGLPDWTIEPASTSAAQGYLPSNLRGDFRSLDVISSAG